ncbi:MAG: 50S ribosomal protein L10 [bacterium]
MPSQKNEKYLTETSEHLKTGKAFYFTDFTGLTVKNMEKLRRELKKNNGSYLVLKNTIGFLAMKQLGFDETTIKKVFSGPTGIAIAFDDPIVLAKILTSHENLKVKGSLIEGDFFTTEQVIAFSKIPSKDTLYSQVVGSLSILSNFVGVLEGIIRNLMYTLEEMKNKEVK